MRREMLTICILALAGVAFLVGTYVGYGAKYGGGTHVPPLGTEQVSASGLHRLGEGLDPICRTHVDTARSREAGLVVEADGETFFFCSEGCKGKFPAKTGAEGGTRGSRRAQVLEMEVNAGHGHD